TVFGRDGGISDFGEALSYRRATIGLAAGALYVGIFAGWVGMSPGLIVPYFVIFFLIALAVARLRADTGIPAHGLTNVNPQDILIIHLGTNDMSARSLVSIGLFQWFNRFNRAH